MAYNIQRYSTTLTIDVSEDANEVVSSAVGFNGLLVGLLVNAPSLSGQTYEVAIKDVDGYTIFSIDSLTESSKSAVLLDSNNNQLSIPLSGSHTITVTASGDQAADKNFPLVLLIDKG